MEPSGREDDDNHLDFPSARSSLATQSLQGGAFTSRAVGRPGLIPPVFRMSTLEREIEKERIRGEIFREMQERRILEDEVRREMEIERMMLMRRAPIDGFHDRLMVKPHGSEFMIRDGYGRSQGMSIVEAPSDVVRTPSLVPKVDVDMKPPVSFSQKMEIRQAGVSSVSEVKQVNEKILGIKRKAEAPAAPTSKLTKKDWSCDICQIIATCEQNFNDHLQGKKHKAKVEAMQGSKTVAKTGGTKGSSEPVSAVVSKKEAKPKIEPKIINIQVDGKMHQVLQKKTYLWCQSCRLKCNSSIAMAAHLGGKKHNAKMTGSEKYNDTHGAATLSCGETVVEKFLDEEPAATKDSLEEEDKLEEENGAEESVAQNSLGEEVKVKEESQVKEPVDQEDSVDREDNVEEDGMVEGESQDLLMPTGEDKLKEENGVEEAVAQNSLGEEVKVKEESQVEEPVGQEDSVEEDEKVKGESQEMLLPIGENGETFDRSGVNIS